MKLSENKSRLKISCIFCFICSPNWSPVPFTAQLHRQLIRIEINRNKKESWARAVLPAIISCRKQNRGFLFYAHALLYTKARHGFCFFLWPFLIHYWLLLLIQVHHSQIRVTSRSHLCSIQKVVVPTGNTGLKSTQIFENQDNQFLVMEMILKQSRFAWQAYERPSSF